jgi:hypothetical protein
VKEDFFPQRGRAAGKKLGSIHGARN